MSGISSSVGVFSGIDSKTLIDQLLAIEARPRTQAQTRIRTLQTQSAALLDINTRINAIKSSASNFRLNSTFKAKSVTSTNEDALTGTASNTAGLGSYAFRIERLVSTQQQLSRGFADRTTAGLGLTELKFESAKARLDRDVSLADLNDGNGVRRGKIRITDSGSRSATIDLSKAVSVNDVLKAINDNGTAQVTASVEGGKFVIKDSGGGSITIAELESGSTAADLGIAGTAGGGTITGSTVYKLSRTTSIATLRDGLGLSLKDNSTTASNFSIVVDRGSGPTTVGVNIGNVYTDTGTPPVATKTASGVSNVGQLLDRVNQALTGAGVTGLTAEIDTATNAIRLNNTGGGTVQVTSGTNDTTANELGLVTGSAQASITGKRVLASLNSTLASSLNGGEGLKGDGTISITLADSTVVSTTLDLTGSISDIARSLQNASGTLVGGGAKLTARINSKGTGLELVDNTGSSGIVVASGATADSLGLTSAGGALTSGSTITGKNLQKQYISASTKLETLNNGRGLGTGKFRITDSNANSVLIDIASDSKTVGDIINEINGGSTIAVRARLNDTGDGIILEDTGTSATRIKVEDVEGAVAKNLNLLGTAKGTLAGASNNRIDGTFERTVTLSAADGLDEVVRKINEAGVGVTASVITDGNGSTPFRLALTSANSGTAGRFVLDTGGVDIGLSSLAEGQDALAFFGSGPVASAVAVTSSTNTLDNILPGVKVTLKSTSADPVTLTVDTDTDKLITDLKAFVTVFNTAIGRIDNATKYDAETQRGGPLVGDGTMIELRRALFNTLQSPAIGVSGRYKRLSDIGIGVDRGGDIALNEDKFRQALSTDPAAVEALLTTRVQVNDQRIDLGNGNSANNPNAGNSFSALGMFGRYEQVLDRYLNSTNGILTNRGRGITAQIDLQNKRIDAIDVRLESRRGILERQFQAMETAIGKSQQQSSSLSQIGRR
jgi:flagellar hook-associated protein 2